MIKAKNFSLAIFEGLDKNGGINYNPFITVMGRSTQAADFREEAGGVSFYEALRKVGSEYAG